MYITVQVWGICNFKIEIVSSVKDYGTKITVYNMLYIIRSYQLFKGVFRTGTVYITELIIISFLDNIVK